VDVAVAVAVAVDVVVAVWVVCMCVWGVWCGVVWCGVVWCSPRLVWLSPHRRPEVATSTRRPPHQRASASRWRIVRW